MKVLVNWFCHCLTVAGSSTSSFWTEKRTWSPAGWNTFLQRTGTKDPQSGHRHVSPVHLSSTSGSTHSIKQKKIHSSCSKFAHIVVVTHKRLILRSHKQFRISFSCWVETLVEFLEWAVASDRWKFWTTEDISFSIKSLIYGLHFNMKLILHRQGECHFNHSSKSQESLIAATIVYKRLDPRLSAATSKLVGHIKTENDMY